MHTDFCNVFRHCPCSRRSAAALAAAAAEVLWHCCRAGQCLPLHTVAARHKTQPDHLARRACNFLSQGKDPLRAAAALNARPADATCSCSIAGTTLQPAAAAASSGGGPAADTGGTAAGQPRAAAGRRALPFRLQPSHAAGARSSAGSRCRRGVSHRGETCVPVVGLGWPHPSMMARHMRDTPLLPCLCCFPLFSLLPGGVPHRLARCGRGGCRG